MSSSAEFTVSACPVDYAYVSNLQSRTVRSIFQHTNVPYTLAAILFSLSERDEGGGKGKKK